MENVSTNPCSVAVYSNSVASNNSVFNFSACLLIFFVFLGEQST